MILLPMFVAACLLFSQSASAAISYSEGTGSTEVGGSYVQGSAKQLGAFNGSAGMAANGANSVPDLIATIIKTVLSVLGIIFVVLIVMAGFKWMMAGGNDKDIEEAKDKIKNAVIGLVIVLSAYAITAFVFNHLPSTGAGTSGSGPAVVTGG